MLRKLEEESGRGKATLGRARNASPSGTATTSTAMRKMLTVGSVQIHPVAGEVPSVNFRASASAKEIGDGRSEPRRGTLERVKSSPTEGRLVRWQVEVDQEATSGESGNQLPPNDSCKPNPAPHQAIHSNSMAHNELRTDDLHLVAPSMEREDGGHDCSVGSGIERESAAPGLWTTSTPAQCAANMQRPQLPPIRSSLSMRVLHSAPEIDPQQCQPDAAPSEAPSCLGNSQSPPADTLPGQTRWGDNAERRVGITRTGCNKSEDSTTLPGENLAINGWGKARDRPLRALLPAACTDTQLQSESKGEYRALWRRGNASEKKAQARSKTYALERGLFWNIRTNAAWIEGTCLGTGFFSNQLQT
jgi:hypothetical protein